MKTYDYLVAYNFTDDRCLTPCFGTIQVSCMNKISTFEDVNQLIKNIKDNINITDSAHISNIAVSNLVLLGLNEH